MTTTLIELVEKHNTTGLGLAVMVVKRSLGFPIPESFTHQQAIMAEVQARDFIPYAVKLIVAQLKAGHFTI